MTAPPEGETVWKIWVGVEDGDHMYKFQNGAGNYESVPPQCSFGNYGDRQVTVAGADVDVDAVCYGSCNACDFVPAVLSDVTFAVDMVDQTVADDGVFLAGGQWHSNPNAMTAPAAGETIWTITLALEPGQYEYKFQNGDGNYESVPAACGPGSFGNRVVDVGEEAVAVPLTKFGECPLVEGDGGTVTFHVHARSDSG